jgi:hypothetical protein
MVIFISNLSQILHEKELKLRIAMELMGLDVIANLISPQFTG